MYIVVLKKIVLEFQIFNLVMSYLKFFLIVKMTLILPHILAL